MFLFTKSALSTLKVPSCIALYPVIGTVRSTFHSIKWQTCSFQRHLDFSRKHTATLQLLREDYSFTHPHMSIARYLFIQVSELRHCGVNETAKA